MKIFSLSVRRPVAVTVIILAILIVGYMFATKLNIESFPKIEVPVIAVSTTYEGAGPEEIEDQITIPVEEAVGSVGNIDQIESSSSEGLSTVVVEFNYGTNLDVAAADVREKLDKIKKQLPDDADDPIVIQADPADRPIIRLAVTSNGEGNMRRLRSLADNTIKKEIEKIAGIASVNVTGGEERAIMIEVDQQKIEAMSIPINAVSSAIAKENIDIPSGRITASNLEFTVRAMGQMRGTKDFEDILITKINDKPIYLKDIAKIRDTNKEVRKYARFNSKPAVTIEVRKNTDANTVKVADSVKVAAKEIEKKLPSGYKLSVAYDSSKSVKKSIKNLQETGLQGAILAIIIILIFLGSVRSTFVIGFSIPFSVMTTLMLMYFSGLTINMMTLVGFILAIGNIVDASIVVLENIYRHLEMGKEPKTAAIEGAQEVGGAVLGAAATTIIVFVPIFLLQGIEGQIFSPLAKTFIFAITSSFIAAISIVPMLCARLLGAEVNPNKTKKTLLDRYKDVFNSLFDKLIYLYKKALKWSLRHRPIIIILSILLFASSIVMAGMVRTALQGKWDRGDFNVSIELPVGSSLDRSEKVVDEVEKFVLTKFNEVNDSVVTDIGQGPSGSAGRGKSFASNSPRMGGLTVSLIPAEERPGMSMYDVQDIITDRFSNYTGAEVQVEEAFSISGKKAMEILIRGDDLDILANIATKLKNKLEKMPELGLRNLDISYRPGAPEYKVKVNRKRIGELGMGSSDVSNILRVLLSEDRISTYREGGEEYDIFIQLPEVQRDSIDKIKNLKFLTPSGKQVALSEIATITPSFGPTQITRRDRARYVSVQADLASKGAGLKEVIAKVVKIVEQENFPTGYTWELAGEEMKRQEIFTNMFQVLFLAILFCYVFLAVQFESFIHPFTIMMAVPLELAGVYGALLIADQIMTMFALLGIIMLVGIVVSVSIVLIDYIIQRKESGMSTFDAIMEAAPLRLRPIMMTTLTTIIAMVPLALGLKSGTEMYQPLAVGSIGGLLTASVLTLIVIPVIYSMFEDFAEKFSKKNRE